MLNETALKFHSHFVTFFVYEIIHLYEYTLFYYLMNSLFYWRQPIRDHKNFPWDLWPTNTLRQLNRNKEKDICQHHRLSYN